MFNTILSKLQITRRTLFAILAGLAIIVGSVATITACSGSGAPQTAAQILQSDGYTANASLTQSLQSGIGSDSMITSSQAGENSSGSVQAVVVFDNSSDAQLGQSAVNTELNSSSIAVTTNGDVLTATGPLAAWAAAGS
jgi:hypothetical protein